MVPPAPPARTSQSLMDLSAEVEARREGEDGEGERERTKEVCEVRVEIPPEERDGPEEETEEVEDRTSCRMIDLD